MFGEVEVDPLAESFSVTPQTTRRELNQLCQLRLLQRVHGTTTERVAGHLKDHVGLLGDNKQSQRGERAQTL